jgi:O-antigen ligase
MKAQPKIILLNISTIILGIVLILLVTNQTFMPIAIIAWSIVSFGAIILGKLTFKFNVGFMLMILLYLLFLIGVFWSANKDLAYLDLQLKICLILVPALFLFLRYTKFQLKLIVYSFFIGLLFSFVYSMTTSLINFMDSKLFSEFMYYFLSKTIHPTYLAFYTNIAIAILLLDYMTKRLTLFRKDKFYILLIFVFSFFSLILLSRLGIVTTMFLNGILVVFWLKKRKWVLSVFVAIFLTLIPLIMVKSSIWARERLWDELATEKVEEGREIISLTTLRIEIWDDALTVYGNNPLLGVGTGDVQEEMIKQYEVNKLPQAIEENLNPHNQFLQTGIAIGLLGILLVLLILIYPLFRLKKQYYFSILFSIISFLFFITESVLDNLSGIVAFAFFYCIFFLFDETKLSKEQRIE